VDSATDIENWILGDVERCKRFGWTKVKAGDNNLRPLSIQKPRIHEVVGGVPKETRIPEPKDHRPEAAWTMTYNTEYLEYLKRKPDEDERGQEGGSAPDVQPSEMRSAVRQCTKTTPVMNDFNVEEKETVEYMRQVKAEEEDADLDLAEEVGSLSVEDEIEEGEEEEVDLGERQWH